MTPFQTSDVMDVSGWVVTLLHSVPVWGILGFILHRWLRKTDQQNELKAKQLEEHFRNLNAKLDEISKFNEFIERRMDAVDAIISFIVRDSFSSSMIARGSGGWPNIFRKGASTAEPQPKDRSDAS